MTAASTRSGFAVDVRIVQASDQPTHAAAGQHANECEGAITRVVFEGATLHFFAKVNSSRVFRLDVAGVERLELLKQDELGSIRFGFSEVTLIPKSTP